MSPPIPDVGLWEDEEATVSATRLLLRGIIARGGPVGRAAQRAREALLALLVEAE